MGKNDDTEIFDDKDIFVEDLITPEDTTREMNLTHEFENTVEKKEPIENRKIKKAVSILLWLLFITVTALVMYIVVNNPTSIEKVINKIF